MNKIYPSTLAVIGGLLVIGAVFADRVGLDHNTSWGVGRTMLLVAGLSILFIATVWFRFRGQMPLRISPGLLRKLSVVLAFILCGTFVILVYVWFISTGKWTYWPATMNYYDRLATTFREGHLDLDAQLDPALLALPDPYEPDARRNIQGLDVEQPKTIWDMSLYQGKIYMYWGPTPAILLAAIKFIYSGEIGDQILTFAFIAGLFVFQSLILLRAWRRFFSELPIWSVAPGILLVAFINPIPWILNIPRIYEAAIASGQFFFVGGLFFVFSGLDRRDHSVWRLFLAGTFWSLAVGSRATIALPVSFLALATLFWILKRDPGEGTHTSTLIELAGFGMPLLTGAILLGWYNFARFGSVVEFGFRYAITMLNQNKYHDILFSSKYLFPNLYLYIFNPPAISHGFPFVRPVWNGEFIASFNDRFHTIYNAEKITGLVFTAPFSVFALIPVTITISGLISRGPKRNFLEKTDDKDGNSFLQWLLVNLSVAFMLEFITIMLVFYATMRYFVDATPTLALLSMFGFWQGYQRLPKKTIWRGWYITIAAILIIVSITMSLLLAFSSDIARIRLNNPAMLTHLRLFFMKLLNSLER